MKKLYIFMLFLVIISGSSCAPIKRISGYVPIESELNQLSIGETSKSDVLSMLGEPMVSGRASDNSWFYIQQHFETTAFMRPKITSRTVVELVFDQKSILSEVKFLDERAAKEIVMEKTIVSSQGRKLTFWQQMFGNVGNFSSEQFIRSN